MPSVHPQSQLSTKDPRPIPDGHAVVLFDGVCNLCNSAVGFIIDRDPKEYFLFASLQSEVGQNLLARHGYASANLESMIVVEAGCVYERSSAALRISRHLGGVWPLLYGAIVIPRFLRDPLYNWVARNRYRWFGRQETCRLPTSEIQDRFL